MLGVNPHNIKNICNKMKGKACLLDFRQVTTSTLKKMPH